LRNAYTVSTDLSILIRNTVTKIQIEYFSPEQLNPNPWNSNRVGPDMEARLEASIREFGFVKPIVCRRLSDNSLQIIGGEHRVRKAKEMGIDSIPAVVLGGVSDKRAMALGLADNGRYGEDDALKLSVILGELDESVLATLPYDEQDLAGIFSSASISLDDLGFDEGDLSDAPDLPLADAPRATLTHDLMRFKVPIEDRDRVENLVQHVIKSQGLSSESDSMVAAGMALVLIVNAARDVL
jgi:ParB family chromosome partitioning protein